jgi:hypothetical protein
VSRGSRGRASLWSHVAVHHKDSTGRTVRRERIPIMDAVSAGLTSMPVYDTKSGMRVAGLYAETGTTEKPTARFRKFARYAQRRHDRLEAAKARKLAGTTDAKMGTEVS